MDEESTTMFDESIKLELQVADLYLLFYKSFPQDADFWWALVLEEKNHAALIRSIKALSPHLSGFPHILMAFTLKTLKDTNISLFSAIEKYKDDPPSRAEAFNFALNLEHSAGELHYQEFMNESSDKQINSIFKRLNGDDKDHAIRIHSYMGNHGISVE